MLKKIMIINTNNSNKIDIPFGNGVNIVECNNIDYDILGVVDFAFGGNRCVYHKSRYEQVEIRAEFVFGDVHEYFKRLYPDKVNVYKCDENYEIEERYTVDKYKNYILEKNGGYNRELIGSNIRKNFVRVDEECSLYKSAVADECNIDFLKVMGEYKTIKEMEDERAKAELKLDAFDSACKCGFINISDNKREYYKNKKRLDELNIQLEILKSKITQSTMNGDISKSMEDVYRKEKYAELEKERISLESQVRVIKNSRMPEKRRFEKSFESLQTFFPEANIEMLEGVECFHERLRDILSAEFDEREKELQRKIYENKKMIDSLKNISFQNESNNDSVLRMLDNCRTVYELTEQNKNFETKEDIMRDVNDIGTKLNAFKKKKFYYAVIEIKEVTYQILNKLNKLANSDKIKYLIQNMWPNDNDFLNIESIYCFVFDLAMMRMTKFPFLIYDKKIWDGIDDESNNIVQEYLKNSNEQIIVI